MVKSNLTKGEQSRLNLINSSREIFNEFGLDLRIKDLADKMGVKTSMITNHFPTKVMLIRAISEEYEEKVSAKIPQIVNPENIELVDLIRMSSCLMDIQLEYVCTIMFHLTNISNNLEEKQKTKFWYLNRKNTIHYFMSKLVEKGVVKKDILEPKKFDLFIHSFFILSIHWLNNFLTYDFDKDYKEVKPLYLKAKYDLCWPYLTEKGLKEYELINFSAECCYLI